MKTINNEIPLVPENTTDPAAGLNLSLKDVDALLQAAVLSIINDPPVSPVEGDRHLVSTGTGVWAGKDDLIAQFLDGAWSYYAARYIVNLDDGRLYVRNAGGWSAAADGLSNPMTTAQDLIFGGESGAPERLAAGSNGQVLTIVAGELVWVTPAASSGPAPVVTESGTSLTANSTNAGNYTRFTNAAAKTYSFDSAETYAVGDEYHGRNAGAGDLTLTEVGSFVINPPAGGTLVVAQSGSFTLKIVGAAEADLIGSVVAA